MLLLLPCCCCAAAAVLLLLRCCWLPARSHTLTPPLLPRPRTPPLCGCCAPQPQRWAELENAGFVKPRVRAAAGKPVMGLPQLVAGGHCIGGYERLQNLQDEGKLKAVVDVLTLAGGEGMKGGRRRRRKKQQQQQPASWTSPTRVGRVQAVGRVRASPPAPLHDM